MPRITPLQVADAQEQSRQMLERVQRSLGMVPNLMKTMAHSPATLSSYLGFSQTMGGALNTSLNEQLALAIAGANQCDYCASAHTALGAMAGISQEEMKANLVGESPDYKTQTAINFVRAIVEKRGRVSNEDLRAVREAGYKEDAIVEMIALVALNTFTNYLNHVAETDIDFPVVETGQLV